MTLKIGVAGCTGRMGQSLIRAIAHSEGVTLAAGSIRAGNGIPALVFWHSAGIEQAVAVVDSAEALVAASDVVIDFTHPSSTLELAQQCAAQSVPLVCGTTGLSPREFTALQQQSAHVPLLWSSNMSVGVNMLMALVQQVAATLDDSFDIDILEMHHRNKVDAPSGTALALGKAAAEGRNVAFDSVARLSREGNTGVRPKGEIGFATLRGGDVIGDHTVVFAGEGERIELTHKASNRMIYAYGAIRAAQWLVKQPAGMYSMQDVLSQIPTGKVIHS